MNRFSAKILSATISFALLAHDMPALARTPAGLGDLVGARGSSGESELIRRGYQTEGSAAAPNGVYTYWWNKSVNSCVRVYTTDGRYAAIDEAGKSDCGKDSGKDAAVIAGVVALAGIAALAANSRKKNNKYNDRYNASEYDRGYQEGYNHARYNNFRQTDAYANGYNAGINDSGYYPTFGTSYRGYEDLVGRSNDYADNQLRIRGYVLMSKNNAGSGHERFYLETRDRRCISVRTRSGTVDYIQPTRKRNCR